MHREIPAKGEAPLWERILTLVSGYDLDSISSFDAPETITQAGIADKLGVTRAHATLEINRLLEQNLVEARKMHVRGRPTRLLTYFATPAGREALQSGKPSRQRPTIEENLRKYGVIVDPDDVVTLKSMLEAAEARGRAKRGESNSAYTLIVAGAAALALVGIIYSLRNTGGSQNGASA